MLAFRLVERLILLRQLFVDDVANFRLNLFAGHFVERRQVDQVEQALVQLHLEVSVSVTLGEGPGISRRDQPMLFERARGRGLSRCASRGFFNLPHG